MPGRPKLHKLAADIKKAGGDEYVFSRMVDGDSIAAIMETFGRERKIYYDWLKLDPTGRRTEMMAEARKMSAWARAERAGKVLEDLADDPDVTSARVSLAHHRSAYELAMAAVCDRETFGKKENTVEVNLSLGDMALDALRRRRVATVTDEQPNPPRESPETTKALTAGSRGSEAA